MEDPEDPLHGKNNELIGIEKERSFCAREM